MIRISAHPGGEKLYSDLEKLFISGKSFISPHQHFCFICGAGHGTQGSIREEFLIFISKNPDKHSILPIIAEEAIDEFLNGDGSHSKPDLGEFENLIGECVDSVLIFPESAGSLAELGFFAAKDNIRNIALVVNQNKHQGNSFITLGLIPLFNAHSAYNPMLILEDNHDQGFQIVIDRLQLKGSKRKYRTRFPYESFETLSNKNQMIALHELIRVFGYITEQNLFESIHKIFKKYDLIKVKRLLAILYAMKYVSRTNDGDYWISKEAPSLLEYDDASFDNAQVSALNFYQTNDPEVWKVIENIS